MNALFENASPLFWIVTVSLLGGLMSVAMAGFFALNAQKKTVPLLVSYAIGALLGAVFLEILPHAIEVAPSPTAMTSTVLFGILLFFALEKLVLWRHCHGDHCEAHALHDEAHCPDHSKPDYPRSAEHSSLIRARNLIAQPNAAQATASSIVFRAVTDNTVAQRSALHSHRHAEDPHHDQGRSGMMIMIGDTFHNFVDGILIAAAFMVDTQVGFVTALAILSHEIPQEVGDFLILLHSGYSKRKALLFNLSSSLATVLGGVLAYFALSTVQSWVPYILSLAAASMLYVAVADLIPGLHKRTAIKDTVYQLVLIALGVTSIAATKFWIEGF